MQVDRNYVDTHGQSEIRFAFCSLLGFQLLPRLKNLHSQKLYRPETGQPDAYPNLQPVLTRPVKWDLIKQQYDEMINSRPLFAWPPLNQRTFCVDLPAVVSSILRTKGFWSWARSGAQSSSAIICV